MQDEAKFWRQYAMYSNTRQLALDVRDVRVRTFRDTLDVLQ